MTSPLLPNGHIALANFAAFTPGKSLGSSYVQSRMLLWCVKGKGEVKANGRTYAFTTGSYLVLPWGHSVWYKADDTHPFRLGGVHIIPRIPDERHFTDGVLHLPGGREENYQGRLDVPLPGLEEVVPGEFDERTPLWSLANYIVGWFKRGQRERWTSTLLANALVAELLADTRQSAPLQPRLPARLRAMMTYAEIRLERPIMVPQLSKAGSCSPSTMSRMFKQHLGLTPVEWLNTKRMSQAAELLATTHLGVGEIGEKVGVGDPYYFSKLFKRHCGMTAKAYRRKNALL